MDQPIVSIITPSFNRADIIHETAASIFRQKYPHWEWMIVDDGSTDNSWEVINNFSATDNRVKVFRRDREPKGACSCRNIAVEQCSGYYVIFLDTDDLLASFCLEQRVKAFQDAPGKDFVIFPMLLFKTKPDDLALLWNIDKDEDEISRLLKGDPICQGTGTLWKKESFKKIGMWREDLQVWQDIELHLRSFFKDVQYHKRMDLPPDIFLRISDISLSRTGYHSKPKLQSRIKVFQSAIESAKPGNKISTYISALRIMGVDIILSSIRSNNFTEATEVTRICEDNDIVSDKEASLLLYYLRMWRLRLYKLPYFESWFSKRFLKIVPFVNSSMGKINYPGKIEI